MAYAMKCDRFYYFFYRLSVFGMVRFAKVGCVLCRQKRCIYALGIVLYFAGGGL